MGQIIKDQKDTNRKVSYEDISSSLEERPDLVYYIEDDIIETDKIIIDYIAQLKTFIDVSSLNENEVNYLVIGGYAVAVHGHPRYTKDIDIWIEII